MKKNYFVSLFLLLMMISVPAFAAPADVVPAPGQQSQSRMQALTPDQQKELRDLVDKYKDKIIPLKDQLDAKRMELNIYSSLSGISKSDVRELTEDIVKLRREIRNQRQALYADFEKAGLAGPEGICGPGRRMLLHYGLMDMDRGCPIMGNGMSRNGMRPGMGGPKGRMGHGMMDHGMNQDQGPKSAWQGMNQGRDMDGMMDE